MVNPLRWSYKMASRFCFSVEFVNEEFRLPVSTLSEIDDNLVCGCMFNGFVQFSLVNDAILLSGKINCEKSYSGINLPGIELLVKFIREIILPDICFQISRLGKTHFFLELRESGRIEVSENKPRERFKASKAYVSKNGN